LNWSRFVLRYGSSNYSERLRRIVKSSARKTDLHTQARTQNHHSATHVALVKNQRTNEATKPSAEVTHSVVYMFLRSNMAGNNSLQLILMAASSLSSNCLVSSV